MTTIASASQAAEKSYVIDDVPGKGKGMSATRTIAPGEVILQETPLMMIRDEVANDEKAIWDRYVELSDEQRFSYNALACHARFRDLSRYKGRLLEMKKQSFAAQDIFDTNAIQSDSREWHCLGLEFARINHSCMANANFYLFEGEQKPLIVVRALTKIEQDEEITVPYTPAMDKDEDRAARLWYIWGFECQCNACTTDEPFDGNTRVELVDTHNKLVEIRGSAEEESLDPDTVSSAEQRKLCEFWLKNSAGIPAFIMDRADKLKIYLRLLQKLSEAEQRENDMRGWCMEAVKLFTILGGPDDARVVMYEKALKGSKT